ncbi:MAG: CoA transferase [Acidobacteriota bacterium]|nr:CoA transferase [Acidobacteriota bacterium]
MSGDSSSGSRGGHGGAASRAGECVECAVRSSLRRTVLMPRLPLHYCPSGGRSPRRPRAGSRELGTKVSALGRKTMPALDGMRILDMTQYEAGTSCTQALAWLGADVVKIERPGSGDPGRGAFDEYGFEDSEYFLNWNSNKRSVTLALDTPEGRELLLKMAPRYDAFVENFGPGVVEKLDIGYDVLKEANPAIIYGRIKGFGLSGPYAEFKCFDPVAQAAGGSMSVTGEAGEAPVRPGATIGDAGTGVQMALALCAAYVQKLRTGKGQMIELSMQEAVTYYIRTAIAMGSNFGEQASQRNGNGIGAVANLYPCKPEGPNDFIYICAITPRMWQSLCAVMDRPDLPEDPRFVKSRLRLENGETLAAEISAWTRQHDKHEAMLLLGEAGVPASAVFDTVDLFNDPHLLERDFVHTIPHPKRGTMRLLAWPARMTESSVDIEPAPFLGGHTDEVLAADLGLGAEDIAALREQGVIGAEPTID